MGTRKRRDFRDEYRDLNAAQRIFVWLVVIGVVLVIVAFYQASADIQSVLP